MGYLTGGSIDKCGVYLSAQTTDGIWRGGQTFTDAANGITIVIDRWDETGAQVTVTNGSGAPATTSIAG